VRNHSTRRTALIKNWFCHFFNASASYTLKKKTLHTSKQNLSLLIQSHIIRKQVHSSVCYIFRTNTCCWLTLSVHWVPYSFTTKDTSKETRNYSILLLETKKYSTLFGILDTCLEEINGISQSHSKNCVKKRNLVVNVRNYSQCTEHITFWDATIHMSKQV
jgi:hypothetical protein